MHHTHWYYINYLLFVVERMKNNTMINIHIYVFRRRLA